MDKQQILDIVNKTPELQQAVAQAEQALGDNQIPPEALHELIKMLEFALQNPNRYAEVRQAAIEDDYVDPEDLPEEYNPALIITMLAVLYGMEGNTQMRMAKGGLASMANHLQAQGRYGDTMLAHISPEEAAMLKRMGGSGTINPHTGLPEFFSLNPIKIVKSVVKTATKAVKSVAKAVSSVAKDVAPIAAPIIMIAAPELAPMIGTWMGASGAAAAALGSAAIGGGVAALGGGNVLQGAVLGGLTGGAGNIIGGGVNSALNLGLSGANQALVGSSLMGALAGHATGQGATKGALMGALGAYAGNAAEGFGKGITGFTGDTANRAISTGLSSGLRAAGNMLTAGYSPKQALIGGGLTGIAAGAMKPAYTGQGMKPSTSVVEGLKAPGDYYGAGGTELKMPGGLSSDVTYSAPTSTQTDYSLSAPTASVGAAGGVNLAPTQAASPLASSLETAASGTPAQVAASTSGGVLGNIGMKDAGSALLLASAMKGATLPTVIQNAPSAVQSAYKNLPPEQQEYFNRPSQEFDWVKMLGDASNENLDLQQYMARHWDKVAGGMYNVDVAPGQAPAAPVMNAARGGLSKLAYLAKGAGSGRADTIDARLSDGEYVMDAETVAMLGDGSTKEGARRLDGLRANLRKHKGTALAKGKFSPNAKSPLAYMKGAA